MRTFFCFAFLVFVATAMAVEEKTAKVACPGLLQEQKLSGTGKAYKPDLLINGEDTVLATWADIIPDREKYAESLAASVYDWKTKNFRDKWQGIKWIANELRSTRITNFAFLRRFNANNDGLFDLGAGFDEIFAPQIANFPTIFFGKFQLGEKRKDIKMLKGGKVFRGCDVVASQPLLLQSKKGELVYLFIGGGDKIGWYHSKNQGQKWLGPYYRQQEAGWIAGDKDPSGQLVLFSGSKNNGSDSGKEVIWFTSVNGSSWNSAGKYKFPVPVCDASCFVEKNGDYWLIFSSPKGKKADALFVTRSKDKGATWENPLQVTPAKTWDIFPSVVVARDRVFVLFQRASKPPANGGRWLGTAYCRIFDKNKLEFEKPSKKEKDKKAP